MWHTRLADGCQVADVSSRTLALAAIGLFAKKLGQARIERMTDQNVAQREGGSEHATTTGSRSEAELRARLAQLSQKVEELSENLRASETAYEVLNAEATHLRRENQAIHTSMSWRVTRPLRMLRGGA